MPEANVIDPIWVLDEETGKLYVDSVRCIASNPRHRVVVRHLRDSNSISAEFADRYKRLLSARRHRGIER